MADPEFYSFNRIIRKIIEKSLFTERQIEIILNFKNIVESKFDISKGAYYRQVSQSREKLSSFYYTMILLRGLGVVLPDDVDVISQLSEKISVIKNSDVPPEKQEEIMSVISRMIMQLNKV